MITDRKVTGRARSIPVGMVKGWMVSMFITVIAAVIATYLVLNEAVKEETIGTMAMVILPLASALGALVSASSVKRRWMLICMGAGCVYFLTLLSMTALFFGGRYSGIDISAVLIFGAAGGVGALGLKGDKKPSKNKRFRHYG